MSASLKVRCTNCNQRFQPAAGTCPVCAATNLWEPCVVETVTTGIDRTYVHASGVAFFAYEEAAKAGIPAPSWATATVPANSNYTFVSQRDQRLHNAIVVLRQWSDDADATTATTGNSVVVLNTLLDRFAIFFDNFADLLESLRK